MLSCGLCGELLAVASPGVELGEEDEVCACGAGTTSATGSLFRKTFILNIESRKMEIDTSYVHSFLY